MKPRVLLGIGGGIAAYKMAFLTSRLVQGGAEVRVAMTPRAAEFVGALTFAGLTGRPVVLRSTQIDADGSAPHIEAARWAQVYCIAPATADLLARLASGAADDAVSLLAITCRCAIVVCPAMNDAMWTSAAVRDNCDRLRARGVEFVGPVLGHLAEGYDAIGRMVEPEQIRERLLQLVAGKA